jgi:hypothetical protein
MKNLARFGCMARSFVYLLIGVLALLVALGNPNGRTTDTRGALRFILDQPFGGPALLLLGVGLIAYAVWRVVQSVQDRDRYGRSLHGTGMRLGFFFSGIFHGLLGFYAFNLVFNFTRTTQIGERVAAKWVLNQPLGNYALEIGGAIVVITGTTQFLRAFNGAFLRDLRLPKRQQPLLVPICRVGLVARGIVFVIIGSFFFQSGWKYRSREAGGLHKAWETLHQQPFGDFLLGSVAIGFMAFAVFGFIEGFYRKTV